MTLARASGGSFERSPMTRPILQEYAKPTKQQVMQNRLMMAFLGFTACSCMVAPICYHKMPKPISGGLLLISVLNFSALSLLLGASEKGESFYKMTQNAQKESFKQRLEGFVRLDLAQREIDKDLAGLSLIQSQPEALQAGFMNKFGLGWMMAQPPQQVKAAFEVDTRAVAPAKRVQLQAQSAIEDEYDAAIVDEFTNLAWVTPTFLLGSKFIFAPKGSGKSCWLTYEAVMSIHIAPEGTLWICDIHYDAEESNWLPGMPQDMLEERYLFTKPDAILKRFRLLRKVLRDRAGKSLRKEQPVKLICDEFDGFLRRLEEGDRLEVAEIVQEVEDEGRKFDVFQTLVAHGAKKEQIYLDSTAINQMSIMAMGNALADPNTKFPGDMDVKGLLKTQQAMQENVPSVPGGGQLARAVVVRRLNEAAEVVYIPHPDILLENCSLQLAGDTQSEALTVETDDAWAEPTVTDPMSALKEWYQVCKANGSLPSDSAIAAKFSEFTGRPWQQSKEAMQYLKDLLQK